MCTFCGFMILSLTQMHICHAERSKYLAASHQNMLNNPWKQGVLSQISVAGDWIDSIWIQTSEEPSQSLHTCFVRAVGASYDHIRPASPSWTCGIQQWWHSVTITNRRRSGPGRHDIPWPLFIASAATTLLVKNIASNYLPVARHAYPKSVGFKIQATSKPMIFNSHVKWPEKHSCW